jgi:hypothetical protein
MTARKFVVAGDRLMVGMSYEPQESVTHDPYSHRPLLITSDVPTGQIQAFGHLSQEGESST